MSEPDAPEPQAACICKLEPEASMSGQSYRRINNPTCTHPGHGATPTASVAPDAEEWHFLDKRSKAIANREGLKLEFASHQDAELGRRVLDFEAATIAALTAEREEAREIINTLKDRGTALELENDFLARQHDLVKGDWMRACEQRDALEAKAGLADEIAPWLRLNNLDARRRPRFSGWLARYDEADALEQATPPEEAKDDANC